MMADDLRDLRVVLDFRENPLADLGVLFHLPTLAERKGTRFFEQSRWQPDLADVVHKSTLVRELLLLLGQADPLGDVTRVDGHGRRMPGGIPVSSVKCGNESGGEGEVRTF